MSANTKEQLVKTLSTLALSQHPKDEFAGLLSVQNSSPTATRLQEVLKAKREKQNDAAIEDAAEEVLKLVTCADSTINNESARLAAVRRQAEQIKQTIETVAVARIYGERTMNWLPLAAALGKVNILTAMSDIDFAVPADQFAAILKEVKAAQAVKVVAKAATKVPAKRAAVTSK